MPRLRRHIDPNSVQHLISRFTNNEFRIDSPEIRDNYLRRFPKVLNRNDWIALTYGVMTSHVHHVLRAGHAPCARIIQPIHSGFAAWLNRRQNRLGPVFAGRFTNIGFEGEHLAVLLAYVHNNPVRAGVVVDPADSDWTSHRAYIGDAQAPEWLDVDLGLALCDFSATPSGRLAFHEFVLARSADPRSSFFSGDLPEHSDKDVRAVLGGPAEMGSMHVLDHGLQAAPIWTCPEAQYSAPWHGNAITVLELVANETGIPLELIQSRARRRDIVLARRLAVLVWYRFLGRPLKQMSNTLSISLSAASQLLARREAIEALDSEATRIARWCHEQGFREVADET